MSAPSYQHANHRAVTFLASSVKGSFPKNTDIICVYINSQLLDERANDLAEASAGGYVDGCPADAVCYCRIGAELLNEAGDNIDQPSLASRQQCLVGRAPIVFDQRLCGGEGLLFALIVSIALSRPSVVVRSASVFS